MATVASSIAADHLHGLGHHSVGDALTSGYRVAFAMAGIGLLIGVGLATLLPKFKAPTPQVEAELHAVEDEIEKDQAGGLVVVDL
jgi:dipeptide/tripeptide permease